MSQRNVLAAVLGGITLFLLGYLFYGVLLADYFAANGAANQPQMVLWALGLGELVFACLMAYIFSAWAAISTFAGGAKGGALIGALSGLSIGLIMFGAYGMMTLPAIAVDTLVSLVRGGIAGGVIGAMLGRR
jgi:hypothetical protein